MKLKVLFIFVTLELVSSCAQNKVKMDIPKNANKLFKEFIEKDKFIKEKTYPGISDEKLRPILTKKINEVAIEFQKIAESKYPTKEDYLKVIKSGLTKFPELEIGYDSEDRERICSYFEELMDIIKLDSSNGLLNKFYYGFNISESTNKN